MARTANFSIRFDEDKLKFFLETNPKLEKPQQVVDYLLDKFYWEQQFGNNPISERNEQAKENIPDNQQKKTKPELSAFWKQRMAKKLGI